MSYITQHVWQPELDLPTQYIPCKQCANPMLKGMHTCEDEKLKAYLASVPLNIPTLVTPRNKLLNYHHALSERARRVMEKKNQDYGEDGDPFRNFRTFGPYGILVRLSDKLSRLRTFVERGSFQVNDESFEDTIMDALNYIILLSAMVREKEVIGEATDAKVPTPARSGGTLR